jgi:two-component system OmpR family response regulator
VNVGYEVDHESNGMVADNLLQSMDCDLVILDLGLPGLEGLEILHRMRSRDNKTPVLLLTARDDLSDRVRGLDLGADDYLTKPFEIPELEARVRALIRRTQSKSSARIEFGGLCFDTIRRKACFNDTVLNLSAREINVLEVLISSANMIVSRKQMEDRLFGLGDDTGASNAIDVYVHRLRKKLEVTDVSIRSIRGLGYLLEMRDEA